MPELSDANLPDWLPAAVRRYIHHTEDGTSLRALARREGDRVIVSLGVV